MHLQERKCLHCRYRLRRKNTAWKPTAKISSAPFVRLAQCSMFKTINDLIPLSTTTSYTVEPLMYVHSLFLATCFFIIYFFVVKDIRSDSKVLFQVALLSLFFKSMNSIFLQGLIFFGKMYEGGDSIYYDDMGIQLLPLIREDPLNFVFSYLFNRPISSEGSMFSLTGLLYYFMGVPSLLGASVIASFVSSLGAYFFFKSYRLSFPQSGYKWFGYLVFLSPSLLFWTSQHLKEPWVIFYLGLMTYGICLLAKCQWLKGFLYAALGFYYGFYVKAYLFLFLVCALMVQAFMVRMKPPAAAFFVKGFILVGILFFIYKFQTIVFEVYVGQDGFFQQMALVKSFSVRGGSAIALKPMTSLGDLIYLPYNAFTVLFRPLFFEAHNVFALMASLESATYLLLALFSLKNLGSPWKKPGFWYFLMTYVLIFSIALSFPVGNLGTMVRIRINVLPFLFMLFSFHLSWKRRNAVAVPVETELEKSCLR